MGRGPRYDYPGAFHHVMNQGTAKTTIFADDEDRADLQGRLGVLEVRFDVAVHAYAQLGNHYHALLESKSGELSRAMHWLDGTYARRFNNRHGRVGTLFRGRFRSQLVEDERYRAWLGPYIHLNPVADGFVDRPEDWRWSSYRAYVGVERPPKWLRTGVLRPVDPADYAVMTEGFVDRSVVGVVREPAEVLVAAGFGEPAEAPMSIDVLEESVARAFDVPVAVVRGHAAGPSGPRTTAIALAPGLTGMSLAEIATAYELKSRSSVTAARHRLASRLRSDYPLRERLTACGLVS